MYILFYNTASLDQFLTSQDVYENAHIELYNAFALLNHFVRTLIANILKTIVLRRQRIRMHWN
jgi:hypothetical protein